MFLSFKLLPSLYQQEEGEGEGEGEGGFIACEGIEHSQSRLPQRRIPCHAGVVGDLVRCVTAPATQAKFHWIDFPYFT